MLPGGRKKKRRLRSKSNDPLSDRFIRSSRERAFLSSAWIPFPSRKSLNILDVARAKLRNSKDKKAMFAEKVEKNGDLRKISFQGFSLRKVSKSFNANRYTYLSLKIFRVFHFAIQNFG